MSLFLKYRPKSFSSMVGQHHIVDILLAQANKQEFSGSYLLYGPRGTGKTSTARLLAKMVNCTTFDKNGHPDLERDPAAQLIDQGKTLDFVEIDAASHTGVDNIRDEIIDKALYPPAALKTKVYVIDEVHMLSKGAFNALLKIMEEPRDYLLFVLATTEIHKVPDTIVSRCQVFNFKHLSVDQMVERLAYIADQEQISYQPEGLRLIAKLSQGAMRDAIKYLEQISILGEITEEHVATFLGVVADSVIADFLKTISEGPFDRVAALLDELSGQGTDFSHLVKDILLYCNEHFLENPERYAVFSGVFQEIAAEAKRYPHPLLLRKRKLRLLMETEHGGTPSGMPATQSAVQRIQETTVERHLSASTLQQGLPKTSQGDESKSPSVSSDEMGTLLEQIIDRVEKKMLKSVLMKHVHIRSLQENVLTIIVINQQYFSTVQKPEIVSYLQGVVSELLDKEIVVKREYMSKDAFLVMQMGG